MLVCARGGAVAGCSQNFTFNPAVFLYGCYLHSLSLRLWLLHFHLTVTFKLIVGVLFLVAYSLAL